MKDLKVNLEKEIIALIEEFEDKTDIDVVSINLEKIARYMDKGKPKNEKIATVEIKL